MQTSLCRFSFRFSVLLLIAIGYAVPSSAQDGLTTEGREFWFGFMPNYITPAQRISIYVGTRTANKIKLEMFGEDGVTVLQKSVALAAGQVHRWDIAPALAETRERELAQWKAIRVSGDYPLTAYGYSDNSLTTDGFLALPTGALGKEYYCFSYYDDAYSPGFDHLGGEFLIVAPHDNTKVTIKTNATTTTNDAGTAIGHNAGDEWTVTLERGQSYLVQTTGWNFGTDDLTGSRVTSDKPVAFLSGHQRASIEIDGNGNSKDHLIEMIPPTNHWGTDYVGIPQNSRTKCGNYYRVISAEDGNQIRLSHKDTTITLDKGEYAEVSLATSPVRFHSLNKKRFMVAEYSYKEGFNGDPAPGDPFMHLLTPVEAFVNNGIFRTPSNVGTSFKHYATFVTTEASLSSLMIKNGLSFVPASHFGMPAPKQVPNTPYWWSRLQLSGDEVAWITKADVPFGMHLYGYASVESYGWSGPRRFSDTSDVVGPAIETISADTCGDHSFAITDAHGIADIFLAPVGWAAPTSNNYALTLDPGFEIGDTTGTATLRVIDKSKDATFSLYIVDKSGNDTILTRTYTARPFSVRLQEPLPVTRLGDTSCTKVIIRNESGETITVDPTLDDGWVYRLEPIQPYVLAAGDSAVLDLCFIPRDTMMRVDTIEVSNGCLLVEHALAARSAEMKIKADDHYFGMVRFGDFSTRQVKVTNLGEVPATITGYQMSGDTVFKLVDPVFPQLLQPGEAVSFEASYTPDRDSADNQARIDWVTDKPATLFKTHSILTGIARKPMSVDQVCQDFKVWPNPAGQYLWFELPPNEKLISVSLIDLLGAEHRLAAEAQRIAVGHLPTGAYTLIVRTSGGEYRKPLVISR